MIKNMIYSEGGVLKVESTISIKMEEVRQIELFSKVIHIEFFDFSTECSSVLNIPYDILHQKVILNDINKSVDGKIFIPLKSINHTIFVNRKEIVDTDFSNGPSMDIKFKDGSKTSIQFINKTDLYDMCTEEQMLFMETIRE